MKKYLWLAAALFALGASAADETTPAERPAVDTAAKKNSSAADGAIGTTIIGEKESAIGLYITPWKEEYAGDMDRPPGLLDESPAPLGARAFHGRVEYYDTVAAYRRAHR